MNEKCDGKRKFTMKSDVSLHIHCLKLDSHKIMTFRDLQCKVTYLQR